MNLNSLTRDKKVEEFEFPGLEGFKVQLCMLSKNYIQRLIAKSTKTTYDKKNYQPREEFDNDKFLELFTKEVVKGWEGLKASYLPDLLLADISQIENPDEVYLDYSQENAVDLMTKSTDFERWVNTVTSDLGNFNKPQSKESSKE